MAKTFFGTFSFLSGLPIISAYIFIFGTPKSSKKGFGIPSSFVCFLQLLRFCLYHAYIATAPSNIWMMNWETLPSASIVWNASFRPGDLKQQFLWWLSGATCLRSLLVPLLPRLAFRRACRRNSSFCELFAMPQVELSCGSCLSCG